MGGLQGEGKGQSGGDGVGEQEQKGSLGNDKSRNHIPSTVKHGEVAV